MSDALDRLTLRQIADEAKAVVAKAFPAADPYITTAKEGNRNENVVLS